MSKSAQFSAYLSKFTTEILNGKTYTQCYLPMVRFNIANNNNKKTSLQ